MPFTESFRKELALCAVGTITVGSIYLSIGGLYLVNGSLIKYDGDTLIRQSKSYKTLCMAMLTLGGALMAFGVGCLGCFAYAELNARWNTDSRPRNLTRSHRFYQAPSFVIDEDIEVQRLQV